MKYLIVFSTLLFASILQAADYDVDVCALQAQSTNNTAFLQPCNGWQSQNNCPSGEWITWNMSEFQGEAMYSTALSALMANKKVKVRLDGYSCNGNYDNTSMVRILN